jgi:hypothetical protein
LDKLASKLVQAVLRRWITWPLWSIKSVDAEGALRFLGWQRLAAWRRRDWSPTRLDPARAAWLLAEVDAVVLDVQAGELPAELLCLALLLEQRAAHAATRLNRRL